MHDNFVETWRVLCADAPGVVHDEPGITYAATGIESPFFNAAFVVEQPIDAASALQRIREFFDKRELPFSLRVPLEFAGGFGEAAGSFNLGAEHVLPAMILPSLPEAVPPPPPGLTITEVTSDEELDRYIETTAAGFGGDVDLFRRIFLEPFRRHPEVIGLAGYRDGELVATSAVVLLGGTAGIYNVATPEQHRRQGLGEALTWAAVERGAQEGFTTATLQASAMGAPIYQRMGFVTVLEYLYLEST